MDRASDQTSTPEDRLMRGEATETDLLVIVRKLGEDLLEARDALEAIDGLLDRVVVHDGRNVLNIPQAQVLAQKALGKPVAPGAF